MSALSTRVGPVLLVRVTVCQCKSILPGTVRLIHMYATLYLYVNVYRSRSIVTILGVRLQLHRVKKYYTLIAPCAIILARIDDFTLLVLIDMDLANLVGVTLSIHVCM